MSEQIVSRVYQPNAEKCCEACVFCAAEHGGRYEHAEWCDSFGARTWRGMPTALVDAAPHSPGDWICAECCERDPAFDDTRKVLDAGDCERCLKTEVPLFRIPGIRHGSG